MRERIKKKNNIIIGGLLAVVFLMTVGYAAFASNLTISGTANTSSWIIKITNIQEKTKTGGASTVSTNYTDLTANFSAALTQPGDSITYEVTVENQGNIDASVKEITKTYTNNKYIEVTYSDLVKGQMLYKQGSNNSTATMLVTITFKDLEIESLTERVTSNISLTLDFVQEGNNMDTTKKYLVEYDSMGGTPVESKYVLWDETCLNCVSEPTKVGYVFDSWKNSSGNKITDESIYSSVVNNDDTLDGTTLYAVWYPKTYRINYDGQGSSTSMSPLNHNWDDVVRLAYQPVKTGYTFSGWYTDIDGKGFNVTAGKRVYDVIEAIYGKNTDVAGGDNGKEITLYAYWIEKDIVLQFDSQGGSEVPSQTYKWTDTITLPTTVPEKEGYTFSKWVDSLSRRPKTVVNGTKISDLASTDTEPVTIYAQWNANS